LIARHGQSAGNVARDAAEAAGHVMIELATRDMDVPLSDLGERQADALGRWLGKLPRHQQPAVILTSPYRRARATAGRILAAAVLCFRYLIERLTEEEILRIDRAHEVANCSITAYDFDPQLGRHGKLALRCFNFVAPLEEAGEPVTSRPDVPVAPR